MATDTAADAALVEKLYEYGERLNEAKDKSQHVGDYEGILMAVHGGGTKSKQLAAQLIPKFFKFFPGLASKAASAHFDLLEEEELGIRVQAIRGLPLLCKDTPDYVTKIVDVLGQLVIAEENVERDAVHKALMSLLRQDSKASLSGLFKHVESSDENIREKVICFLKDKVFPLKAELLKPQEQMERHVTDLVKKSLRDVTGAEFKLFMDFLSSLSIFGESAPPERIQELIEIIEGHADLDVQFNVADIDHIDRLISCMFMAIPYFVRGASSSKFLTYYNKHVLPVFDKVSVGNGTITSHALMSLEARGVLFVSPGMETYEGMIIGEHSRDTDLDVNPVRTKELTNVRAAAKDENVRLTPPRLMTLEEAIGYVA